MAHNISYKVPAFKPNDSLPETNYKTYQSFFHFFPFFFAPSLHHTLCLPDSLDSLSDADVIGLKLVQANANSDGRQVQTPPEELSQAGIGSRGDVVNDDGLEADVGVQQDGRAQDGVGGGVERTGGKGRNGERHEAGGEEALKGPVV